MSTCCAQQPSQPTDPGRCVCLSLRPASLLPPPLAGTGWLTTDPPPRKAQPLTASRLRFWSPSPSGAHQVLADLWGPQPRGLHPLTPPAIHPVLFIHSHLLVVIPQAKPTGETASNSRSARRLWLAQEPWSHRGPSWDRGSGTQGLLVYLDLRGHLWLSERHGMCESLLPGASGEQISLS